MTKGVLKDTEKKVVIQDSIVAQCESIINIRTIQLNLKDQIIQKHIEEEKKLAKKNKRLTITRKILSFSLAVMTVAAIISFATH